MGLFTRSSEKRQEGRLIFERVGLDKFELYLRLETGEHIYPARELDTIVLMNGDMLSIPIIFEGNSNGIAAKRIVLFDSLCSGSDDSDVEDWTKCF